MESFNHFLDTLKLHPESSRLALVDAYLLQNPNCAQAYYQRGLIHGAIYTYNKEKLVHLEYGDSDQAIADFEKAIELDPKFVAAYAEKASLYLHLDIDDVGGAELMEQALAIEPDNIACLNLYMSLTSTQGINGECIDICKKIIELQPTAKHKYDLAETYFYLAEEYVGVLDQESLENLEQAILQLNVVIEEDQDEIVVKESRELLEQALELKASMA
ncbi:hypothetical protein [Ferrimonas aestuarii]|uniref:Uncharacterized protein n=1 Tax=Ferrimonas aestuarii TaxID=2569539 RepID=A0A4V5NVU8_9GAMM|nr:hypothetical protein [Ferrimonas aestuarii]TKB51951.1 hypothetical protein FCL42_16155 [Ferrimonas aestuarii]